MLPTSLSPSIGRLCDQLHAVQRIAQIGFWEMCAENSYLTLSDGTCAILGIKQNDFQHSFDAFLSFVHVSDQRGVLDALAKSRDGEPPDIEYRIVQPTGAVRYVHAHTALIRGNDGKISYFGTVQDITERVLRQHEAEQNALLLQIASRIAHMGGWKFEPATGRVAWSDEVCKIHEVPSGTSPTPEQAIAFYAPEWREKIRNWFDACLRNGIPYDEEVQIITANGRKVWVRTIGEPVRDADGTIICVQGALQDITEKRQGWEYAGRLLTTLDSISDAFYTLDRQWRFTYLNKQAERLFQKPHTELLGKVLWDEFEPLKGQVGYGEFQRAMRDNCTVVFEEFYAPYQILSEIRAYPSEEGLTVYFRDITQDRKIQESLRLSEERFQIVAKSTTDAIWDWDLTTNKNWRSENIQNLFGYTPQDFDGPLNLWSDRIHPDDRTRVLHNVHAAVHGQADNWIDEYRFIRKDASVATVLDRGSIIRDSKGHAIRMVGAMVDLTERRQADARIREQAALLDKAKDAIVVRGVDNRVHYWNKGAERLYGWTAEEAVGRSVAELLYDDPAHLHEATRRVLETGEWSGEITERRKDGTPLPVEVQWTLIRDEAGEPQSIFAIKTDITRRKADEHKIQRLAFYDPLTQLPNRQLLMDRVQRAIASSAGSGQTSALLFINLDDFKTLNDAFGHAMGDLLLQQVAHRLTACVGSSDTVARFGGDEYVVMLENLSKNLDEATAHTRTVGETILKALSQPYQLENYQHHNTPSIGITLFDSHAEDASELLKRADLAMYQAKAAGGNTLRFFDPTMQAAISARVSMEADLRQSLREREFCLHFQPQVDMHGRMIGLEALVRWQHPRKGLVSPAEFIGLAEETGLILPLGEWVLETACRQLATWADKPEAAHLEIAVNVSAYQFRHPGFVEQVLGTLGRTGANPRRLKLELTESMLIDNVEDTITRMNMLKARGIGFSLDDFGTGYSSLVYLRRLPLDILKIDRSFIRDLLTNPNDVVIAQMIIALAGNLGLKVIAEGVETEAQRDLLFQHGCDAYQGYLYSKPLPADEISALIRAKYEGHA